MSLVCAAPDLVSLSERVKPELCQTASTPIPTDFLMEKIKREPKRWRLTPDGKLLIADAFDTEEKILGKTKKYLEELRNSFS